MKTYHYCENNGSGTLVISADNKKEADKYLKEIVKFPNEWNFEYSGIG